MELVYWINHCPVQHFKTNPFKVDIDKHIFKPGQSLAESYPETGNKYTMKMNDPIWNHQEFHDLAGGFHWWPLKSFIFLDEILLAFPV